jgi:hypothetical protein
MIETLLAALAFGTVWFWIIAVIASVIFIASIENDHYSTPTITAIILGILYWKSIAAIGWQTVGIFVGVYALVGVIWSVFKWYRFCLKTANKYRETFGNTLTSEQQLDLKGEITVSDHKSRLTGWIAWWPWSVAWGLTGDFFNMLYETMVNAYQRIADNALGKFSIVDPKKQVVTDADMDCSPRRR